MKSSDTGSLILEDLVDMSRKIEKQIEKLEKFEKQVKSSIKQSDYGNEIIDAIKASKMQLSDTKEEIKVAISNIK